MKSLVVVSTFPSTVEAQIAKGLLDEVGIESMIRRQRRWNVSRYR